MGYHYMDKYMCHVSLGRRNGEERLLKEIMAEKCPNLASRSRGT